MTSPGQLATHYAPLTPLRLNARSAKRGEALLAFGPHAPDFAGPTINLSQQRRSRRSRCEFLCRAARHSMKQASRPSRSCQFPPMVSARRSTTGLSAPLRLRRFPSAPNFHDARGRPLKRPSEETLDALSRIVGEDHAIRDPAAMAPYLVEWRDRYVGKAALVLKPGSTEEVAAILAAGQRDAHGDRAARRQYRSRRRSDPVRER